jgi:hypothetical protein
MAVTAARWRAEVVSWSRRQGFSRVAIVLFGVVLTAGLMAALPASADQTITSSGPLTSIMITPLLNCQVTHTGDTDPEFYPTNMAEPGACTTQISVGGVLYGPETIPAGNSPTPYTPVSQSAVTGTGTAADPFRIVTTVDAGTTGIHLTETDSYVTGEESYRTDVQISNSAGAPQDVIIYRAGDCFLQSSDFGFGVTGSPPGAIACALTANNSPPSRIEQWLPLTAGSHYFEAGFDEVWAAIDTQTPFNDTCRCAEDIDNGAGLSWSLTIPAAGSTTVSHLTTFSPVGIIPLTSAKTADQGTVPAGAADAYNIQITNPNATEQTVTSITDTLPAGFTYTPGSSTGATTTDPTVSGQTLTWAGPFTVPAAAGTVGTLTLHFGVTVSSAPGTYLNSVTAEGSGLSVAPTGPTAPVEVTGTGTTTTTGGGGTTTTTAGGGTTTTTGGGGTTTTTGRGGTTTTTGGGGTTTSTRPTTTTTGGGGSTTSTTGGGSTTTSTRPTTTTTGGGPTTTTAGGGSTTTIRPTTTTTGGGPTSTTVRATTTTAAGGSTTTTATPASSSTTVPAVTATTAPGTTPLVRTGGDPLRFILFGLVLLMSGATLVKSERNLR